MNRFLQVKDILDTAVGGAGAPVGGVHGPFWRNQTKDEFVNHKIGNRSILTVGDGSGSLIVQAMRAQVPFGSDTGTPGATVRRMPAGRGAVPPDKIDFIAQWIDDGCPEDVGQVGTVEVALDGAPGDGGFLIVSGSAPVPGRLSIRTTDGSQGEVTVRAAAGGATLQFTPGAVQVSGTATEVQVVATSASAAVNDTTIEVVRGADVIATLALTAIARPAVRFRGTFQCRLPTDPDAFDDPWGQNSSFGMYAVQGPDPAHPDEPPLDRIVRFHDPVALRPFCAPPEVLVVAIEGEVGGAVVGFSAGDPLIGQPVRLGPNGVFDGRNETYAPNGLEPIADFRLEIGSAYAGASAPAQPRAVGDPPPSTAPYADGIRGLDVDPLGGIPADHGLPSGTWAENAWTTVALKLAALTGQKPEDERAARIRDRRLAEHADTRIGHGLPAITTALSLLERYTGLVDREITVGPDPRGMLAYLAGLDAARVTLGFLAFDTDCQTGHVTGTLDAPVADATPAEPVAGLLRIPLDEQ